MIESLNKISRIVLYCFVPSIMLDYFCLMLGADIHRYIASPIILGVDFFAIILILRQLVIRHKPSGYIFFFLWFAFNLVSVIAYANNGRPINCYKEILRPLVFPMLFFFFAYDSNEEDDRFYDVYLYSCVFCFVIGIALYATMPPFYIDYIKLLSEDSWQGGQSEDYLLEFGRMSSFFKDSYAISYTSVPAIILSLGYKKDKKQIREWVLDLFFIISLTSAMLCQQRAAMVSAVLVVLFYFFYDKSFSSVKYVVLIVLLIIIGTYYLAATDRLDIITSLLESRYDDMFAKESLNSGRTDQYNAALSSWNNIIMGDGIGSCSSIARKYGFNGVSDGEYIRILTETGLIGIILFLSIIISSLSKCKHRMGRYHKEMLIILFFLLAMIGSNSLSIHFFYAPIFWYAIGRIWRKTSYNNKQITYYKG